MARRFEAGRRHIGRTHTGGGIDHHHRLPAERATRLHRRTRQRKQEQQRNQQLQKEQQIGTQPLKERVRPHIGRDGRPEKACRYPHLTTPYLQQIQHDNKGCHRQEPEQNPQRLEQHGGTILPDGV
jgi:hypothetical protein